MTAGPVRVVFDTNILVSAHFWKGPPYRCLLAVEAALAILVLSDPILTELGEKLLTKFHVSQAEVGDPRATAWPRAANSHRWQIRVGAAGPGR